MCVCVYVHTCSLSVALGCTCMASAPLSSRQHLPSSSPQWCVCPPCLIECWRCAVLRFFGSFECNNHLLHRSLVCFVSSSSAISRKSWSSRFERAHRLQRQGHHNQCTHAPMFCSHSLCPKASSFFHRLTRVFVHTHSSLTSALLSASLPYGTG